MSISEKSPENRPKIGENDPVSNQHRVCPNCDDSFSPQTPPYKRAYRVVFGVKCPRSVELYCPGCVEVLSQAIIENSQSWEYPTDAELEAALELKAMRDE